MHCHLSSSVRPRVTHSPHALWTRPRVFFNHAYPLARRVYSPTELTPCAFFSLRTLSLVSTENATSPLGTTAEISER
ncbi:hypothetical protein PGIGA_G00092520 [Pangasianodon gigas]|uniref:Uncharacterized protein n=1 Tax=Pangasianodon gigas TaxID=30993 RepID=A0ACC5XEL0_PANGG|nr:hypothetical protein [Pangasianodon gigas]